MILEFTEYIGFGRQFQRAKKRADVSTRFRYVSLLTLSCGLLEFRRFRRQKTPWIDRASAQAKFIVKVRPGRTTGRTYDSHRLPAGDRITSLNIDA